MKSSISVFKVLRSSWGIWIKISGSSRKISGRKNLLIVSPENIKLSESEEKYLHDGFEWVSSLMNEVKRTKHEITVAKSNSFLLTTKKKDYFML